MRRPWQPTLGDDLAELGEGLLAKAARRVGTDRPGLPYDGHTLNDKIAKIERLTGENVARVYVDKGHRGHGPAAPEIHITQSYAEGPQSSRKWESAR